MPWAPGVDSSAAFRIREAVAGVFGSPIHRV